jgi:annexin A7/11
MKVENKTTSATSSAGAKPASQKPSSEAKKIGIPVTAEKPSATPEKISTEDKYEKETKSDKKEEFFDNVSDLRSMSEKTSPKKEEKPEKLDKEKERKNLITSVLSVSRDALKLARSAIDKLSSCGDSMPCGKTDEQTDPYSVINKAALEVPEDTKKLLDNLFVMTAAEVKDNVAPSEKKSEEKVAENTVKEFRNKHEELRNEWKKRQKCLDKGSDTEKTIKKPDGTETRISTRKKTDSREVDYSLYELREEKDKSGKTTSSKSSLLNRDNDGNFTEHSMERDAKGNEIITDSNVKSDGSTDEKIYEKRNEPPPPADRERTRQERDEIRHKFTRGKTTVKEDVKNPDGTKTLEICERATEKPEVKESEETERKDRNGHVVKDKSTSTYIHNEDGSETKVYERDDGLGNKEYSKLTMKDGGLSERESVTTKSDGTVIKSKEITDNTGKRVIVSDEERPDGSKIHKEKTVEYKIVKDSADDKSSKTADKKSSTDKSVIPDKITVSSPSTDVSKTESKDKHVEEKAPQTTYDPGKESEVLNNAMAGWGANKEAIYNVLKGKSPEELKALKESYKEKYGKDLEEAVKSELKGGDLNKAKALLEKGKFSEADNIKQSLDSWSIRKGDVVKILDGKTQEEIKAIKEEYKSTCGTELDEDLKKTLLMSPIEKEKIELLMKGDPQADMNIKDPKEREKDLLKRKGEFTASKIELDIKALMSVPPPPKSYETKALLDTLYGKSPEEIKAYKDAYKKATGKDLEKTVDILLITSPSSRAIVKSYMTQGKETDAEKLHRAMAGAGTGENLIFKTLEGKSDAERKAIIEDYKKKYGKDLMDDLKGDLGGADLTKAKALLEKGPCYQVGTDTIPPDKLKTIDKAILNREFSEKELREKLTKSGLKDEEIDGILKNSKKDNLDTNTKLDIAMDRWGADKEAIFDTLQQASPETRQDILNNNDMMKKLEGELNDKDYAEAMGYLNSNQSGEVPLKDKLKSSMAGWGTDKNSFYEALDKASPEEIATLKNDPELKKLFDSELNKEDRDKLNSIINEGKVSAKTKIKNSISFKGEDEKKIYEVLENASPEERKNLMNDPEIKEIFSENLDAREMSNVNLIMEKGKLPARTKIEQACKGAGTDEKAIYEALEKATPEERHELMKDPSFKKMMEEELGGNALLRAQILLEKGKTEPVDDLYMAMKGAGTDEEAIFKALSSCKTDEEKDNLIKTYRNKYGRDLQADLKGEISTSEYYKAFDMLQKEPKTMEERKEQMTEKLLRERNSGDLWTNASNNIMDVFSDEGRNLDDSERELRDTYKQIEHIEKQGGKVDEKLLEKLDKAENKVKTGIEDYEESKNKVADGLSTAASITLAVATSVAVTVGTGGAGAVTVPLIIGSALTCATTKVGINKLVKGNSYDLNSGQALTDFTTGAIEGALNTVGGPLVEKFAKLSGTARTAVLQTIMKNPVVAQALKNSTIEGVASFMGNRAVQEIMTNAIADAVTTGVQGGLTTAMDDKTWNDGIGDGLLNVGESGAIQGGMGFATSVVMGTGLKAGEHILGHVMPKVKGDTLDGLEVKLEDPEKFSKAKEILSEGSHSKAELTQKLKNAGLKDEDIKSVLEYKSSVKTTETSVKDINSDEVKLSRAEYTTVDADSELAKQSRTFEGHIDAIKEKFNKESDKIHKIKLENGKEIDFYGNVIELEWIQEALDHIPSSMKKKLTNKIEEGKGLKEILADNVIFKEGEDTIKGTVDLAIHYGCNKASDGQILLNKLQLNKELEEIKEKINYKIIEKEIEGKTEAEIKDTIKNYANKLKLLRNVAKDSEGYNEVKDKLVAMVKYKNAINKAKDTWIDTFNHELAHQIDYDFSPLKPSKRLSVKNKSPFLKTEAHEITELSKGLDDPAETLSETFMMLMKERRKFIATKKGSIETPLEFIQVIKDSPYQEQYMYLINHLSQDGEDIKWPEIENYLDYRHLIDKLVPKEKIASSGKEFIPSKNLRDEMWKKFMVPFKEEPLQDATSTELPGQKKQPLESVTKDSSKIEMDNKTAETVKQSEKIDVQETQKYQENLETGSRSSEVKRLKLENDSYKDFSDEWIKNLRNDEAFTGINKGDFIEWLKTKDGNFYVNNPDMFDGALLAFKIQYRLF